MALPLFVLLPVSSHPLSSEKLEVSHFLRKGLTESRDCTLSEASRFFNPCLVMARSMRNYENACSSFAFLRVLLSNFCWKRKQSPCLFLSQWTLEEFLTANKVSIWIFFYLIRQNQHCHEIRYFYRKIILCIMETSKYCKWFFLSEFH